MNASGLWQSAAGLFDAGLRQTRHAFGYDAVDTGEGKRRAPPGVTRSEDDLHHAWNSLAESVICWRMLVE